MLVCIMLIILNVFIYQLQLVYLNIKHCSMRNIQYETLQTTPVLFFCKLLLKGQGLVIYIITNFTQITKEIFLPPIVRNYKNRKYMNFEISITL